MKPKKISITITAAGWLCAFSISLMSVLAATVLRLSPDMIVALPLGIKLYASATAAWLLMLFLAHSNEKWIELELVEDK